MEKEWNKNRWFLYPIGMFSVFLLAYFSDVLAKLLIDLFPYFPNFSEFSQAMFRLGFIGLGAIIIFLLMSDLQKFNAKSKAESILSKSLYGCLVGCQLGMILVMIGSIF